MAQIKKYYHVKNFIKKLYRYVVAAIAAEVSGGF